MAGRRAPPLLAVLALLLQLQRPAGMRAFGRRGARAAADRRVRSGAAAQRRKRVVSARTAHSHDRPPLRPLADAVLQELVGYQEGSQRSVRCKGGGYFTGLELSFAALSGFTEKVAVGLRLRCST